MARFPARAYEGTGMGAFDKNVSTGGRMVLFEMTMTRRDKDAASTIAYLYELPHRAWWSRNLGCEAEPSSKFHAGSFGTDGSMGYSRWDGYA